MQTVGKEVKFGDRAMFDSSQRLHRWSGERYRLPLVRRTARDLVYLSQERLRVPADTLL
jgi:hypothetical protein